MPAARVGASVEQAPARARFPRRDPPIPAVEEELPASRGQPSLQDADASSRLGRGAGDLLSVVHVLSMQRTYGNHAVQAYLQRSYHPRAPASSAPSGLLVARYESGEHAQFGSGKAVTINGVQLTESDLVALGDMYANANDLKAADPAELKELVRLVRKDKEAFEKGDVKGRVTDAEWEKATSGRAKPKKSYLELAAANDPHFAAPAPGGTSTGDHKTEWEKNHRQALDAAHANAATTKDVPQDAIMLNGFAAHFLTDAFSAGHLVAKTDVMAEARKYWDKVATTGYVFNESTFTKGVAQKVLADPGAKAKLDAQELNLLVWGDVTEERFSELIYQLYKKEPDKFFNVFAKIVHDKLNQSIGGGAASGVEVENTKGEKWVLSGDTTLGQSPKTLEVGKKAVEQSNKNLEDAAKTPGGLNYDDFFKGVWDFTPRPTKTGRTNMQKLIATYADASKNETVDAFAVLTIAQIDTAIDELTKLGRMRKKHVPVPLGTTVPSGTSSRDSGGGPSDAGVSLPGGVPLPAGADAGS